MTMSPALAERATSSFPLSIGTALAFESLFEGQASPYDPDRVIPNKVNIKDYSGLWINVATLYRNILGSVSADSRAVLMAGDIGEALFEELHYIHDLVRDQSEGKTRVVFYINRYQNLQQRHPFGKLREDHTQSQRDYTQKQEVVLKYFLKNKQKLQEAGIVLTEVDYLPYPASPERALIITHCAYDLLAESRFSDLKLLESHTGVLKPKAAWYSKLHNGQTLIRIPFNACMMQVFGDSQTFHPMAIARRKAVLELSEKFSWTALTTKDRLRLCADSLADKEFGLQFVKMLGEK